MGHSVVDRNIVRNGIDWWIGCEIGHSAAESGCHCQLAGYLVVSHVVGRGVREDNLGLALPNDGGDFANIVGVVENLQIVADAFVVGGSQNPGRFFALTPADFLCGLSVVIEASQISAG